MFTAPILKSVEDAQQALLSHFVPGSHELVPLMAAHGRILASSLTATLQQPPFNNSAMDGYAVQGADLASARAGNPAVLQVIERLGAGALAQQTVTRGTAIRIMTGAPIPDGADTVVPFEDTDEVSGGHPDQVSIFKAHPAGAHIRPAGEDMAVGDHVLEAGSRLGAPQIALIAALGSAAVPVFKHPRVAILATGDELVDLGKPLEAGQIYNANSYANAAQVVEAGGEPLLLPIARDTPEEILERIATAKEWGADLLLTSGGVSVGDHDVVRHVLTTHGDVEFWRVNMRPGKPVMFGFIDGMPLLGLPGNPVSAMVCFELFGRPILWRLAGRNPQRKPLVATFQGASLERNSRRTYLRARVASTPQGLVAQPATKQGSNLITAMAWANSLLIIPEGVGIVEVGTAVEVLPISEITAL